MLREFKKFQSDERGTIAIIFGLMAFVIFWCIGLAVDGGRAYSANSRIARAVDAASLAGARGMRLSGLDVAETKLLTIKYFRINYEATGGDWSQIQGTPDVRVDPAKGSVQIIVKAKVPTTFGNFGGIDNIDIGKTSVAVFDSKDLEVSLQLDLTGSMNEPSGSGGSKLDALKSATQDFIDILIPDAPTAQKVRIGLAPFDVGVNAGAYIKAVDGNRASGSNCTFERISPTYQATDDAPVGTDALKISSDLGGKGCPTATVIAMSDDKIMLKNNVKTYKTGGSTAGHLGTAWAYYLLSPNWATIWPAASKPTPYKDAGSQKIAVLMTDGDYNTIGGKSGANDTSPEAKASIKAALDTCAAMKADGIIVYTVGFKLSASAKVTMEACASGPGRALLAENGDQLHSAFKEIANQITTLRLTQ